MLIGGQLQTHKGGLKLVFIRVQRKLVSKPRLRRIRSFNFILKHQYIYGQDHRSLYFCKFRPLVQAHKSTEPSPDLEPNQLSSSELTSPQHRLKPNYNLQRKGIKRAGGPGAMLCANIKYSTRPPARTLKVQASCRAANCSIKL